MNGPIPAANANPKNSALAIWSLVLGVLSLVCFSIVSAVPAVICGHLAYSRIRRSGGALTGDGLAIAGLVTGYIGIAISLFLIPMLIQVAKRASDGVERQTCINYLRQLDSAKKSWAMENAKDGSVLPEPAELSPYLINGIQGLKCPKGGSYQINSVGELPTCSIPGHELADE